ATAFMSGDTGCCGSVREVFGEHAIDAIPAEVGEQAVEPSGHAIEVQVVPEPRLRAGLADARLLRIDFPWMEVEDAGLAVLAVDALDAPARNRIGQQPEVAAARGRQVAAQQPQRTGRDLE